jgi:hypothetical protein
VVKIEKKPQHTFPVFINVKVTNYMNNICLIETYEIKKILQNPREFPDITTHPTPGVQRLCSNRGIAWDLSLWRVLLANASSLLAKRNTSSTVCDICQNIVVLRRYDLSS